MNETAQDRGRSFDYELGRLIGGERVRGSGNATGYALDARGASVLVSGKYTDAESFRVTADMVDECARAVLGPESALANVDAFLVVKMTPTGRPVAVIDLELLLDWIKSPPSIVPATKQETLRATIRVPPFMRD